MAWTNISLPFHDKILYIHPFFHGHLNTVVGIHNIQSVKTTQLWFGVSRKKGGMYMIYGNANIKPPYTPLLQFHYWYKDELYKLHFTFDYLCQNIC